MRIQCRERISPPMASESRAPKTAMIVARRIVRDIDRMSLRPGDKLPPERGMLEEYQVGREHCVSPCVSWNSRALFR